MVYHGCVLFSGAKLRKNTIIDLSFREIILSFREKLKIIVDNHVDNLLVFHTPLPYPQ